MPQDRRHPLRHSRQDAASAAQVPDTAQTRAPAYRLAFTDPDFMTREDLRPVRLQLELLKPETVLETRGIVSTVVIMGSARIPSPERMGTAKDPCDADGETARKDDAKKPTPPPPAAGLARWYEEARKLARLITAESLKTYGREYVVVTGGGPGIMEAGNRGADEAGGQSIGLNIVLPHEQAPNGWVTPDLCFNFHYFAIRKMHFLLRARAICVFPGGWGTLDELFEALTLIQTRRMRPLPFVLFGRAFWERVIDWQALVEEGMIAAEDLDLIHYAETAEEGLQLVLRDA